MPRKPRGRDARATQTLRIGSRCLFIGLLLLLCAGIVQAGPFLPVQRLTLGNMNQDGDLFLRIKIGTVELSEGISFEVVLEHATEAGDYAATGSRFHLRPFETSAWEREAGEFFWETPGGGRMSAFAKEDAVPKIPPAIQMDGFPSRFPKYARLNNVLAGWNEAGDAWVRSESWELGYKNGGLSVIRSPENKLFAVRAGGGKITEIRAGRRRLAAVEWSANRNPAALRRGNDRYGFAEDGQGRMTRVIDEEIGAAIIEFSYNKDGLVERVKRIGAEDMTVSWRKNKGYGRGDSFYKKPFSVEKINDTRYAYSRDGNRVTMKMKPPDGGWKRLRWESRNGRTIPIN
ncbi:MAG: hypothetical protein LBC18_12960 [Opitutaceae bacterium]|nr:hypothetical protein [Opitutaceae bacterium]